MRPHVRNVQLPGLDRRDAEALWTSIVPGSQIDEDVADVLEACGYHPLATSILARSVADGGGDFATWLRQQSHRDFSPTGSTARVRAHVIEICRRDLGLEAEDVLNLLAVSGKPMRIGELEAALREHSIANGEELWTVPGTGAPGASSPDGAGLRRRGGGRRERRVRPAPGRARSGLAGHDATREAAAGSWTRPSPSSPRCRIPSSRWARWSCRRRRRTSRSSSRRPSGIARGRCSATSSGCPCTPRAPIPSSSTSSSSSSRATTPCSCYRCARVVSRPRRPDLLADLMMITGEGAVADRLMVWCGAIRLRINDALGFLEVRRRQTWQSLYEGRLYDTETGLRQVKVQAAAMGVGRLFSTVDPWIGLTLALRGLHDEARRTGRRRGGRGEPPLVAAGRRGGVRLSGRARPRRRAPGRAAARRRRRRPSPEGVGAAHPRDGEGRPRRARRRSHTCSRRSPSRVAPGIASSSASPSSPSPRSPSSGAAGRRSRNGSGSTSRSTRPAPTGSPPATRGAFARCAPSSEAPEKRPRTRPPPPTRPACATAPPSCMPQPPGGRGSC